MSKKIILISGIAGSGKDTFFNIANALRENTFERFAFADELKKELAPSLKEKHGIDIFSCSREEKETVRAELIAHGMNRREESDGTYWVDKLVPLLEASEKIPMICDFRFANEKTLLDEKFETLSIYLECFDSKSGQTYQPTIEEEARNNTDVKKMSEIKILWPDCRGRIELLIPYVSDVLNKIDEFLKN